MAITVCCIVNFKDQTEPLLFEDHTGPLRTVITDYIQGHFDGGNTYVSDSLVVLDTLEAIRDFAYTSSNRFRLHLNDQGLHVESIYSVDATDPLFLAPARRSRFDVDDLIRRQHYYEHYARLYNKGLAVFGARIQNIRDLSFTLSHV